MSAAASPEVSAAFDEQLAEILAAVRERVSALLGTAFSSDVLRTAKLLREKALVARMERDLLTAMTQPRPPNALAPATTSRHEVLRPDCAAKHRVLVPFMLMGGSHAPLALVEWLAMCTGAPLVAAPTVADVLDAVGARLYGNASVRTVDGVVVVDCQGRRGVVCYERTAPLVTTTRREATRLLARRCPEPCVLYHVGLLDDLADEGPYVFHTRDEPPMPLDEYVERVLPTRARPRVDTFEAFVDATVGPHFAFDVDQETGALIHAQDGVVGLVVAKPAPRSDQFAVAGLGRPGDDRYVPIVDANAFAAQVAYHTRPGLAWMMQQWPPAAVKVASGPGVGLVAANPDDGELLNAHFECVATPTGVLALRHRQP